MGFITSEFENLQWKLLKRLTNIPIQRMMGSLLSQTNKQEIKILICNLQDCCEQWGYVTSEDSFDDYIGAELLELVLTDDALQSIIHELEKDVSIDYANCMFINANTSKGLLQFALYNSHNGYYSHRVMISSNQLTADTSL